MILAFDTYYFDNKAKTVALLFEDWRSESYVEKYEEIKEGIADYEPGAFYKRELPCILSLMPQIPSDNLEAILIDGYVHLDDEGTFGLGGHLYEALGQVYPVIGVAKTNFAKIDRLKRLVYRGTSNRPLYITSIDMPLDDDHEKIVCMAGPHRIPHLLKLLDNYTKQTPAT